MSVSVRALRRSQVHNLLIHYTICSSTISTMQLRSRIRASISSQFPTRKRRSTMSRKAKAKVKNQKALKKEKDRKGPQATLSNRRVSQKEGARPSQKAKVNGPLGHGTQIRIVSRIKETKKVTEAEMGKERPIVWFVANQVMKRTNAGGAISNSSSKDLRVSNHLRTQSMFTTSQSMLRINPLKLCNQISFVVFKIYDQQLNNFDIWIRVKHQHTMGQYPPFCLTLAK